MKEELLYMMALTKVEGIGSVLAKNLIAYCGGAKKVFEAKRSVLLRVPGIGQSTASSITTFKEFNQVSEEIEVMKRHQIEVLSCFDDRFPYRLKNQYDCPLLVYHKGNMDLNAARIVAVVGTRKPSTYGRHLCEELVKGLTKHNCLIISGMAYGVDSIAHRAALKHGAPTIGVMAHGLNRVYPQKHANLARQMIESNGGLLSQYSCSTKPDRENFPKRNAVIAGMADALVVVESPKRGGSMISAEYAWDADRPIFVFPGRVSDSSSGGCLKLIKEHKASLIESAEDVAAAMNWSLGKQAKQIPLFELSSEEQLIVNVLQQEKTLDIEKLEQKSGLGIGKIAYLLLELEFKKMVICRPGKLYELA